jgi:glutamate racemase
MNVTIAYRKNSVLSNVNTLLFAMTHYNYFEMEMRRLKARQNLHMNVVIAYKENGVLSNVNTLLFAMTHYNCFEMEMRRLKARQNLHMNVVIAYKENGVLSNVNTLLFAMTHYNCLQMQMRQPRDDGIMEKWTQYVDFAARKCGSKNNRQTQQTTTHNFLCVAKMAKFCCQIFLQHRKSWKFF